MIQAVKGTKDLFGQKMAVWAGVEEKIRNICKTFCVGEIRTPIFEQTELFVKSTGEATDIVQKEMYTFIDKGGRSITLKPEVTAAVVRASIQHQLYVGASLQKYFYLSPCFRYEQTQTGRQRQFHQFGVEYFGCYDPACDAEVIALAATVLKELGIKTKLYINSLGHNECREKYNATLKQFLQDNKDKLCPTCVDRLNKNPLRVLDCKETKCQQLLDSAPSTIDLLGDECRKHFETTLKILNELGIEAIPNNKMVRGLDYYTRTVFEFVSDDIGAQSTVCGGGRYDNLMKDSGGPDMGGIGFAMGMERLMLCLESAENQGEVLPTDLYIGAMGEQGLLKAQLVAMDLRKQGVRCEVELAQRGVKAQLKTANKLGVKYTIVIGDNEIVTNTVKLKNMDSGEETPVSFNEIKENLK